MQAANLARSWLLSSATPELFSAAENTGHPIEAAAVVSIDVNLSRTAQGNELRTPHGNESRTQSYGHTQFRQAMRVEWQSSELELTARCVSWPIRACDMTHSNVWHDSFIWHHSVCPELFVCVTCLISMRDMTYVHDLPAQCVSCARVSCVSWHIHVCDMTSLRVWHVSFAFVTWLFHTTRCTVSLCIMTHSYVWHDSFVCVTCRIRVRDKTRSCDLNAQCVLCACVKCVSWLIFVCDMTSLRMWHISFAFVTWLIHTTSNSVCPLWVSQCLFCTCDKWMCGRWCSCVNTKLYTCECIYIHMKVLYGWVQMSYKGVPHVRYD